MGVSQVSFATPKCVDQIGLDAHAFIKMCRFGHFNSTNKKVGAELEVSGITDKGEPDFFAYKQIPKLNQESFQGEFGSNNVEWNSPAIPIKDSGLFSQLLAYQENALKELRDKNIDPLCCGVLPSMRREFYGQYDDHLNLEQMKVALNPDKPRYQLLHEFWRKCNGLEKTITFPGHSNIRIESCMALSIMSSFQIHFPVQPNEATDSLDIAAMISAAANVPFGNSPRFFGKTGSWEDYRPAFWREIFPCRTGAGPDWAKSLESLLAQLSEFECIFSASSSQNALQMLEMGETPDLESLKTHLGSLWFDQRLKIHSNALTIEERTKGSGTPIDNTAKAVFWTGLMSYYLTQDVEKMRCEFGDFSNSEQNMLAVSEKGLNASIQWMGKQVSVRDLILEELLPLAKEGHSSLASEEVDPFLSIIEKIVRTGKTPAQWIRSRANYYEVKGLSSYETDCKICREMIENQDRSIIDWE